MVYNENTTRKLWGDQCLEVIFMATKSILKDVNIKDPRLARTFTDAMEEAREKRSQSIQISRKCSEITGEKVKEFFGKK